MGAIIGVSLFAIWLRAASSLNLVEGHGAKWDRHERGLVVRIIGNSLKEDMCSVLIPNCDLTFLNLSFFTTDKEIKTNEIVCRLNEIVSELLDEKKFTYSFFK